MTVKDGNKDTVCLWLNLNVTMETNSSLQTLIGWRIPITDAYSADTESTRYDLMILEDDQHLFPTHQGAPLMRSWVTRENILSWKMFLIN